VGDFIRRGFSSSVIAKWDDWLQVRLTETPPDWRQESLESWRFLISPGVVDDAALIGIMAPSCDRVGRLFPFVVASEIRPCSEELYSVDNEWLDKADLMIESMHQLQAGVETLDQSLKTLAPHDIDQTKIAALNVSAGASLWWRRSEPNVVHHVSDLPDAQVFAILMTPWNDGETGPDALDHDAAISRDLEG